MRLLLYQPFTVVSGEGQTKVHGASIDAQRLDGPDADSLRSDRA